VVDISISYLNALRRLEIEQLLPSFPARARILEFGAGTGEQARFLADHGFDVVAIDLANSNYAGHRVFPVVDYDGRQIPLPDRSVDVIFSSNVLEHVENFEEISAEFRRILKPDGFAVHVLPTAGWRFWTFVTEMAASVAAIGALPFDVAHPPEGFSRGKVVVRDLRRVASGFVPRGHGTSAEGLTELWTFSSPAWLRRFKRHGFDVLEHRPIGLFYTGTLLVGAEMPLTTRRLLSRFLGSATRIYKVKPTAVAS
jgi:SAM-dependent methyltransferase